MTAATGTRRKSRELAMQMLFQADVGKQTADQVRVTFWEAREEVDAGTRGFSQLAAAADPRRGPQCAAGGDRRNAGFSSDANSGRDQ